MPWVRDRQERGGVGARRRLIQTRGETLAERFVGPLRVVAMSKPIEPPLLGGQAPPRRARSLGFERLVHALVPAILLGVGGLDQLGPNP